MKKVILIIISIVLVMMTGCEGIKYVKEEKMIYKSKEDKLVPYLYMVSTKMFLYRNVTILKFETKDKRTIEFEIDSTNQQYSNILKNEIDNLKDGEEYVVEYNGSEICSIDKNNN